MQRVAEATAINCRCLQNVGQSQNGYRLRVWPYLFGSTARDEAMDDSDVDLFFDHEKGKLGLFELMDVKERAAGILGRKTDIMTRNSLHPRLRKRIEETAVLIFRRSNESSRLVSPISLKRSNAFDAYWTVSLFKLSNSLGRSAGWSSAELTSFRKRAGISRMT